jgi:hypothetical protein
MPDRRRRAFTLLDLMVLVAAVAGTIGLYRWLYAPVSTWPIWRMHIDSYHAGLLFVTALIYLTWPFLVVGTLAFVTIRLHGARPRAARLMRQPGMVACASALFVVIARGLVSGPIREAAFLQVPSIPTHATEADRAVLTMAICDALTFGGYTVLAAWLVLALGRRWRSEPGWIDRLGRFLGVAWIVWSLSFTICRHH